LIPARKTRSVPDSTDLAGSMPEVPLLPTREWNDVKVHHSYAMMLPKVCTDLMHKAPGRQLCTW
jgi:hypothetical protein